MSADTFQITNYIFLKSSSQPADLAMVFGTRSKELAVGKAVEIYKANQVPKILVSGGINRVTGKNEADEMVALLVEMGVSQKDIILERESTNSLENVLFSRKIIEKQIGFENIKTIVAVTKHYHSRRALMTLKKHFPKTVTIVPVTYEIFGFTKDDWSTSDKGRERVLGELEKIKKYLAKGDIEEL